MGNLILNAEFIPCMSLQYVPLVHIQQTIPLFFVSVPFSISGTIHQLIV